MYSSISKKKKKIILHLSFFVCFFVFSITWFIKCIYIYICEVFFHVDENCNKYLSIHL